MSEQPVERAAAPPKPKGSQKKILGLPMPVALGIGAGLLALGYLYLRSRKKSGSGTSSTTTSTALPQNVDASQLAAELEQLLAEQTSTGVSGFTGGGGGSGPGQGTGGTTSQGGTGTGGGGTGTSTKTTSQTGTGTGGQTTSPPVTTTKTTGGGGQPPGAPPPVIPGQPGPPGTKRGGGGGPAKPSTAPRGSYSQPTAQGATLHWIASPPGQQYHVQVWHDSIATGLVHDSTVSSNSLSVSGLKPRTHYGWRVAAVNSAGQGPYTTGNAFTTS